MMEAAGDLTAPTAGALEIVPHDPYGLTHGTTNRLLEIESDLRFLYGSTENKPTYASERAPLSFSIRFKSQKTLRGSHSKNFLIKGDLDTALYKLL